MGKCDKLEKIIK